MIRRALLLLTLIFPLAARGAEIDSITARSLTLRDSAGQMEERLNAFVREGVEAANEREPGCDESILYREVKRAISRPFIGHAIAERLNRAGDLDSRRVPLRDSVYGDLGLLDAISVRLRGLSAVIRVGDHLVGVDKFGHFFVEGWKYFEIAYLRGEGIERALQWGERTERTYFGLYTTGVYSYADLTVNFDGMRFWLRLLGAERDPVVGDRFFNRPYVVCARRFWSRKPYWRVARRVLLADYVNGAWDEGSNCSRYRSPEIERRIERRIEDRAASDALDYSCPIEPDACAQARARYRLYAERLLHPSCIGVEAIPRPWWRPW